MPISLGDCRELARDEGVDWLVLASNYAERMLPQIFRQDSPVLALALPPETRARLEQLLKDLPDAVFAAEYSLGWVYQFWQADRKDEVNKSEKKIGADELPAVTQLFTEDYMVLFLLHNTLGAWWAGKILAGNPALAVSAGTEDELRAACAVGSVEWTYLRFVRDKAEGVSEGPWRPAAGAFEGWPKAAKDITLLDPCMGSGHFLVFALPILVAFRMTEEALDETQAIEAVLHDNLFGLEIDPRCTQIAAFNLAFAAWRRIGVHPLPPLNLACSGLSIGVTKSEWMRLAEKAVEAVDPDARRDLLGADNFPLAQGLEQRVRNGLEALYDLFAKAPWLGSLIEPRRASGDIFKEEYDRLVPIFASILEAVETDEAREMAVTARGLAKSASILATRFNLLITNVPFLGIRKQDNTLRSFLSLNHNEAHHDLAFSFVNRLGQAVRDNGSVAVVTPQTFLLMSSYKAFRIRLLNQVSWRVVANLGSGAFEMISGEVVKPCLFVFEKTAPFNHNGAFAGYDVSSLSGIPKKSNGLASSGQIPLQQAKQLENPDGRVIVETPSNFPRLSNIAQSLAGIQNGDSPKFLRYFWEVSRFDDRWAFMQSAVKKTTMFGGMDTIIDYDLKEGHLRADASWRREALHDSDQRGKPFWGKRGVLVSRMADLPATLYFGNLYDQASAAIVPDDDDDLWPIWMFCSSIEYSKEVRKIDSKLGVTSSTLTKIPFNHDYWKEKYRKAFSHDVPITCSSVPNQWIFVGQPKLSTDPLQVGVSRLLGFLWPRQTGRTFKDCPVVGADGLEAYADYDGIVCVTALRGEATAEQRLNSLFAASFRGNWSSATLANLLVDAGVAGRSLGDWLRDSFFAQHCVLFHQRPFIWHIWDGRRDGFHALVNYHRLAGPNGEGQRVLDTLIYAYLGDWIDRQRVEQAAGVEGADARLAHAVHLRNELIKIREGEPPYDLFVRWKPLYEQSIGWEPDINDGVRVNIRPFMAARPLGARARSACILRTTPKVKWQKDRGTEPRREKEDYPWFWGWDGTRRDFAGGDEFDGKRWNDLHYSRAAKQAARDRKSRS